MPDDLLPLTNKAAADRLRTLLHQLVQDEPPLNLRLIPTLTATPEEQLLLSPPPEKETP